MIVNKVSQHVIDCLLVVLIALLTVLYLSIHISETAIPVLVRKGIDYLIIAHFAAIVVFPILLSLRGVRILWRVVFLLVVIPVFGLSLMSVSTWFLQSHGICMKGNGYAPLIGFWLFVPYFPLATMVVILDMVVTFMRHIMILVK